MGSSRSAPTSTVTSQVRQEYPEFFQPYLEDVLESSQEQFAREYDPFPEARLVETPKTRTDALTSLQDTGLANMSQQGYSDAIKGTKSASTAFPETDLSSYMNPYQDLVTDQLLRNAKERRNIKRKSIGDQAARVGAFGGSRQAVTESLFDRDTQRELTDLEERSGMANFANALAASSADKERALKGSQQLAGLSQAQQAALTSGLVGVEKAATAEQAINQQIRDVAFQEFMDQSNFDQQKLAEYSAIIRGATPPANQFITKETSTPKSSLQQVAGLGSIASGLFGGGGGGGGLFSASGGVVDYKRGGVADYKRRGVADYKQEKTTEDVVDSAIKTLAGIGSGNIEMGSGQRALKNAIDPKKDEIKFTEKEIRVEGGGLQNLPNDGGQFDMATLVEQGNEDMMMPQQQQLAYGGVPGQAYTEDIGMMGGLASVAGPQMRFAEGDVADPFKDDAIRNILRKSRGPKREGISGLTRGKEKQLQSKVDAADVLEIRQETTGGDLEKFSEEANKLKADREAQLAGEIENPDTYSDELYAAFSETKPDRTKVTVTEEEQIGLPDDFQPEAFGPAPQKKPEVKTPLPTKKKPVGESELAKYLKTLNRDPGISRAQRLAVGFALASGREPGLRDASVAAGTGKGTLSDLAVEFKGLDISQLNEKNKAELSEALRKRAADIARTQLEGKKYALEVIKLKDGMNTASTDDAIKLWNGLDYAGKNNLLGVYDKESMKKLMKDPQEYARRIRQAVASLKPGIAV